MAEFLTMQEAEETSTIIASPVTSETITTLVPEVNKVIDVIIPNGVSIVNQAILDELPTSLPVKGNCAYSVFEIQILQHLLQQYNNHMI